MAPEAADPPFAGRFSVRVDGEPIGSFTEVSGLAATIEVEEVASGGNNAFRWKLPKGLVWPNIVLKRGVTSSDSLFAWLRASAAGTVQAPREFVSASMVVITLHDSVGAPYRTWALSGAFPVRWTGPRLSAGGRDLATEELELTHHGLTPLTPPGSAGSS